MTTIEPIESGLLRASLAYPFLEELHLTRDLSAEGTWTLKMVLAPRRQEQQAATRARLVVDCERVRELRVGALDHLVGAQISVLDVSTRQLESVRYQVREEEHDLFSFVCLDCKWRIVELPVNLLPEDIATGLPL